MEKKREKEIDIKLKAEGDSEHFPDGLPELVLPADASNTSAHPNLASEPHPSCSPTEASPSLEQSVSGNLKKLNGGKKSMFSNNTLRSVVIGVTTLALGAGLFTGIKLYRKAPRYHRPVVEFMTPSILFGLVGDPDSAYAMQMMPVMVSDYTNDRISSGKSTALDADSLSDEIRRNVTVPHIQKQIAYEELNKFISQAKGGNALSTLALSTALSANGKSDEAIKAIRPLIDKTQNPMMKGFMSMLLTLSGDLPGALSEINQGLDCVKLGKMWTGESGFSSLYTMKSAILRSMGRPEEALAVFDSPDVAEKIDNDSWNKDVMLQSKAAAYLQLGQPDKAIVLICQCKDLSHIFLSTAYLIKGDYGEALAQAQSSYLALSRYYSQHGELNEALNYAEKADTAIHTITTLEQRVFVLNQLKRYHEALAISGDLTDYKKLRNAGGSLEARVQIHADRALAFVNSGDAHSALVEANLALANNPTCRRALEAGKLASSNLGDLNTATMYENRLKQLKSPVDLRPIIFVSRNEK